MFLSSQLHKVTGNYKPDTHFEIHEISAWPHGWNGCQVSSSYLGCRHTFLVSIAESFLPQRKEPWIRNWGLHSSHSGVLLDATQLLHSSFSVSTLGSRWWFEPLRKVLHRNGKSMSYQLYHVYSGFDGAPLFAATIMAKRGPFRELKDELINAGLALESDVITMQINGESYRLFKDDESIPEQRFIAAQSTVLIRPRRQGKWCIFTHFYALPSGFSRPMTHKLLKEGSVRFHAKCPYEQSF